MFALRLAEAVEDAALSVQRRLVGDEQQALAGRVLAPTLVMPSRGDARVPFDESRKLAGVRDFLRAAPAPSAQVAPGVNDPLAERDVLRLVAWWPRKSLSLPNDQPTYVGRR